MAHETLSSIVQKFKERKVINKSTLEKQAVIEEAFRKERENFELQGFLNPIFEKITEGLLILEKAGIKDIINEVEEIYGKEKEWNFVIPEGYQNSPFINDPDFEYPGKHLAHEKHDPGSFVKTKVLFSRIVGLEEPGEIGLTTLEKDMSGNGENLTVGEIYDFEDRRGLYKKAARKPRKLGLRLEVTKRVVDNRELEGINSSSFKYELNPALYEITRRIDFVVFEENPNRLVVNPRGRSKEKTFDLRLKTAVKDLKNYLGEVISDGGDISGVSHIASLPYVPAPRGPWLGNR